MNEGDGSFNQIQFDQIMVSCLLVTLPIPERFCHLRHSIAGYCRQTHQAKELIIVFDQAVPEAQVAIDAHVSSLGRNDIRIVALPNKLSLGALRNLSRDCARGEVLCQWDDDDLHHPQRLERQLRALIESGAQTVCLEEVMQFFPADRMLYCTNWRATEARAHPGTLMCKSSAQFTYPEKGPSSQLGEDLAVSLQLQRQGGFHALAGLPHLFVYVSHGKNSWADDHHRMLATRLGVSQGLLRRREAALRQGLATFDFGPGDVTVQGSNGSAFVLCPERRAG
ncbi:MAG: glycosyltransferase [Xanthobacteraceae bacterium]